MRSTANMYHMLAVGPAEQTMESSEKEKPTAEIAFALTMFGGFGGHLLLSSYFKSAVIGFGTGAAGGLGLFCCLFTLNATYTSNCFGACTHRPPAKHPSRQL